MSKKRSLFVQSMTAIEASFTLGYDKHSAKKQSEQPDHSWRVYSFAGKANLLDTAHNLCECIKEHYPEVDKVRQIRPQYCQEWLVSKAWLSAILVCCTVRCVVPKKQKVPLRSQDARKCWLNWLFCNEKRRTHIGTYTLQIGSFPAILHQNTAVGVSLTAVLYLVLQENLSFWSAAQFWG